MCKFRHVRNYYTRCRHGVNLPQEEIKCYATNCVFSPEHPPTCGGQRCRDSCWQYHQYPQQYTPHIDGNCPNCEKGGS